MCKNFCCFVTKKDKKGTERIDAFDIDSLIISCYAVVSTFAFFEILLPTCA